MTTGETHHSEGYRTAGDQQIDDTRPSEDAADRDWQYHTLDTRFLDLIWLLNMQKWIPLIQEMHIDEPILIDL